MLYELQSLFPRKFVLVISEIVSAGISAMPIVRNLYPFILEGPISKFPILFQHHFNTLSSSPPASIQNTLYSPTVLSQQRNGCTFLIVNSTEISTRCCTAHFGEARNPSTMNVKDKRVQLYRNRMSTIKNSKLVLEMH